MADEKDDGGQVLDDDASVQREAKPPLIVGIAYLGLLLVAGLAVLLIAGGLIRL